jgi:outer membrane murein-binding lipoprotein Lpp
LSRTGKGGLIALGIIAVILGASLGLVYMNMSAQVNSLTTDKSNLQSQVNTIRQQLNTMNSTLTTMNDSYLSYEATHSHNDTDYDSLNTNYNSLNTAYQNLFAAKLVKVDIVGNDSRPLSGTPSLNVTGYVVNVGSNTAYNGKLHVIAYSSEVKAIETDIILGTIPGEVGICADSSVSYGGNALTSWTMTPTWTTS